MGLGFGMGIEEGIGKFTCVTEVSCSLEWLSGMILQDPAGLSHDFQVNR